MSVEVNENPIDVEEVVEKVMDKADKPVEYTEFLAKVEEVCKKNSHGKYDVLKLGLQVSKDNNAILTLYGVRKESTEETKARTTKEVAKKKFVDDQELKEYLRLKKKFDKRSAETSEEE